MFYRPLLLTVCLFATIGAAAQDPILCLSCDAGAGDRIEDVSGYGHDAELIGDYEWTDSHSPEFGAAIEFGLNAYGEISHDDIFHLGTKDNPEFTLMCWARIDGDFGDQQMALEKGPQWGDGEYSLLPDFEDAVLVQAFDLDDACDDEIRAGNVIDGEWHHLAGTFDGEALRVFIDGALAEELTCPGELRENNEPIYVASRAGTQRWTNGAYDEIRIYDSALSETQIGQAMSRPCAFAVTPKGRATLLWGELKAFAR